MTLFFSTWATQARFNCCLTQFLAEYPLGTWKDRQSCEVLLYGYFSLISCGRLPILGQATSRPFFICLPGSGEIWKFPPCLHLPRMQLQVIKQLGSNIELAPSGQSKPPLVFSCHLIPPVWCHAVGLRMWGADNMLHLLMLCV